MKLLDFGLARPLQGGETSLTVPGTAIGTPRFMAPEQWSGAAVDARTDLFAAGALLFEMLTGKPAFDGGTLAEIYHAVMNERPPALTGSAAIAAVDRVIHRALAKRPEDRPASAQGMADELRTALALVDSQESVRVRTMPRLIVLPFRVLRPDPEIDFLAFSLADAITAALSGLESLVVRSSLTASKYAGGAPDPRTIAAECDVDIVLSGTLLRAGDQVRLSAQLAEAPAGTLVWSKTSQTPVGDVFQLQDDLARQVVESLELPLSTRDRRLLQHDVPATPRAYGLYLRANQASRIEDVTIARDLYRSCLEEDPNYAPAWARLGRVYRVMAKYGYGGEEYYGLAEVAFRKALERNPDLPVAHNLITYFEVELGRSHETMTRLLTRAAGQAADPELFAGLVMALRYCGLLGASLAAHQNARRLDPGIRTSVKYTHLMMGDYSGAIAHDDDDPPYATYYSFAMMGREPEAITGMMEIERRSPNTVTSALVATTRTALMGDRAACKDAAQRIFESTFHDPEGLYFLARDLAHVGELDASLEALEVVIEGGFTIPTTLERDPWLDPLRTRAGFVPLLRRAEERRREAADAYTRAGGERILGAPAR